ncbi:MAG: restriction endonuclease [Polyangiaceae bacterium]|nr:restriction endonuclease [Polyangiaceae bacterium]
MTFTEAAALVLRMVGKPLHYKEITDVAIEKNLLSHVGKSPEVTMGARLAALVKKAEKDNPLVRLKPGVFALREWDPATIQKGLADRTPALDRIAQNPAFAMEPAPESEPTPGAAAEEEEEASSPDEEERRRAKLAATATAMFAPEEDDDEPILGSAPADEDDDEGDGGRRKRGRRRRGRSEDGPRSGGDDLPGYTVSEAPAEVIEAAADAPREPRGDRERGDRERGDRERGDRGERDRGERDRGERDRGERDRDRGERDRGERDRGERDRDRGERDRGERRESRPDAKLDDLSGEPLADAAASLLASFDAKAGPVPMARLVEAAQRRGRLAGDPQHAQAAISAAVRADNLRRQEAGQRPRFRAAAGRVALTDWSLDGDLGRLEREAQAAVERYRDAASRALLRKLQELPPRGLAELMLLLLERGGATDVAAVRRPGAGNAELHFAARLRGSGGDQRVAVVLRRDGREIGRERVAELRGGLHHYGPAHAGWLVTTGQVLSGAREEAAIVGAAPVALFDGLALARLCDERSVAVAHVRMELPFPDLDLLEALRVG